MSSLLDDIEIKPTNTRRFGYVTADRLLGEAEPTDWLIHGIMAAETLCSMFGDPGTFKTIMAIDWGCCIATGTPWKGRKVKQGPVFFIIGEGKKGFGRRLMAWSIKTGVSLEGAPVFVSEAAAQFLDNESAKEVAEVVQEMSREYGNSALVVVDTLARNFGPGNENSTEDMNKFIAAIDESIGITSSRLTLHHSGVAAKERGRGSSALHGALDTEYKLEKKNDIIILSNTKMKDEPEFMPIHFEVEQIPFIFESRERASSVYLNLSDRELIRDRLTEKQIKALGIFNIMATRNSDIDLDEWALFCAQEGVYSDRRSKDSLTSLCPVLNLRISGNCVSRT